jgi:hypothetical protein
VTTKYTNAELQNIALGLAPHIHEALNQGRRHEDGGGATIGFCLCLFELQPNGNTADKTPLVFVANTPAADLHNPISELHRQTSSGRAGVADVFVQPAGDDVRVTTLPPKKEGPPS